MRWGDVRARVHARATRTWAARGSAALFALTTNQSAMRSIITSLIAILAIAIGIITQRLPAIIDRLLALENDSPGLERLRIGAAMAGGGSSGTEAMADAIKTTFLAKMFGVRPTSAREAWRRLVHTMAEAERMYLSPSWGFGLGPEKFAADEIAEGLKYVSHVTKLALDLYLEDAPRFVRLVSPTLKLIGDNPDAQYHIASLRSHDGPDSQRSVPKEFIVEGCRGATIYFSFSVHTPGDGSGLSSGAFERVVTDINDESIRFDKRGCFKLHLSAANPGEDALKGATWLETPEDASSLVTRHYFNTWPPGAMSQTVELSIRPAIAPKKEHAPEPVADELIAYRLDLANDFIRRHTILMPQPDPTTAPPFFALLPNKIGIPQKWKRGEEGMGAVDIAYAAGRFRLEDGEALILKGAVPRCRFGNVVLWNRFLQTFDYSDYDMHPVFHTLETPSNGQEYAPFTIVLSKQRPENYEGKWMYTEGRPMGTVFFRFLLPEGEKYEYQRIETTVVPVREVAQHV